jgi:hypothetical protein
MSAMPFASRLRVAARADSCTCEPAPSGDGKALLHVTLRGFDTEDGPHLDEATVRFYYRAADGMDPDLVPDSAIESLVRTIRYELSPEATAARQAEFDYYFGKGER